MINKRQSWTTTTPATSPRNAPTSDGQGFSGRMKWASVVTLSALASTLLWGVVPSKASERHTSMHIYTSPDPGLWRAQVTTFPQFRLPNKESGSFGAVLEGRNPASGSIP
ncbi:hypothetical protein Bind_0867 [Beijerinckia indica subsp. indica ATCC 9039]|uniref:Uncharacterized protein n=1 Tax=Beijerinckia indica subsp. indica (strain ATCC 9039 / DSM 1715 / NCIMB 8712) TaxID=395963 RepID=B2IHJ6_BEII9|nr:hypothetical protein Bind_0867 [Beijerinckia indica subsp. indica ATCC 9039]